MIYFATFPFAFSSPLNQNIFIYICRPLVYLKNKCSKEEDLLASGVFEEEVFEGRGYRYVRELVIRTYRPS